MLAPSRGRFPCNAGARAVPSPTQRHHPRNAVTSATLAPVRHWCPCNAIPHATTVPTRAQRPPAPEGATHCSSPPAIGGSPLCRGPRSPRGPGSSSSSPRRPPAGKRRGFSGDQHPQRLAGAVPGVGASRGAAVEPGLGAGSPYLTGPLHGSGLDPHHRLAASRQSARQHHNPAPCGIRASAGERERKIC